jgi:hypothetical protein
MLAPRCLPAANPYAFTHLYNTEWLIERRGHLTPQEAYAAWQAEVAA